jgi:CheY-like chemotaxis protein
MTSKKNHIDGSLILVVENHLPLLRNLAFLLQVAGLNVVTATNGEEALKVLKKQTPDVIIADTDMPTMDGYELLSLLRAHSRWNSIPFIFTSEHYSYNDLMRGLDLGASDYVPKPYDINDMLDAVIRVLPESARIRLAS